MKIFTGSESSYSTKVNFVDDNDVFVGYDTSQCCCEDADWYLVHDITPYSWDSNVGLDSDTLNLEPYTFNKEFFTELEGGSLDEGRMVVFKLEAESIPDLYLHIYNAHNGYYSHGLEVKHDGEIVKDIYL